MVIEHFLDRAKEALATAKAQGTAISAENTDDIEEDTTVDPDALLMDVALGADTRAQTAQEIVTPWVKMLWESYRTVLDILRNNAKLEHLYQVCLA